LEEEDSGYRVPKVGQSMTEEDEYKNDSDKQLFPVTILRTFLRSFCHPLDIGIYQIFSMSDSGCLGIVPYCICHRLFCAILRLG